MTSLVPPLVHPTTRGTVRMGPFNITERRDLAQDVRRHIPLTSTPHTPHSILVLLDIRSAWGFYELPPQQNCDCDLSGAGLT